jgi:hypothetical protein
MQIPYPLRTSLLHLNLMRFATPHNFTKESEGDFKADTAWFKAHKRRQQVVRAASYSEFGVWESKQYCGSLQIPAPPTLWVLVQRSGSANHIIIPVFVGDQCFPTDNSIQRYDAHDTDDALQVTLHYFHHNQGYDALNLLEWHRKWETAVNAPADQNGTVN